MSFTKARAALFATGVAILGIGGTATAGGDSRQEASYRLTETTPASPSGETLTVDYVNPDDAAAKPPAVRKVVTKLPPGARFDTGAPGRCTASDAELMALGADACPADSEVAEGVITLDTGVEGPARFLTSDTTFLNNAGELIFLNTVRGTDARVVVRGQVTKRRIVTESPFLPGTPPDGAAIDTVEIVAPPTVTERGSYITTPRRCPAKGSWTTSVRFRYDDGEVQTVRDKSSCSG